MLSRKWRKFLAIWCTLIPALFVIFWSLTQDRISSTGIRIKEDNAFWSRNSEEHAAENAEIQNTTQAEPRIKIYLYVQNMLPKHQDLYNNFYKQESNKIRVKIIVDAQELIKLPKEQNDALIVITKCCQTWIIPENLMVFAEKMYYQWTPSVVYHGYRDNRCFANGLIMSLETFRGVVFAVDGCVKFRPGTKTKFVSGILLQEKVDFDPSLKWRIVELKNVYETRELVKDGIELVLSSDNKGLKWETVIGYNRNYCVTPTMIHDRIWFHSENERLLACAAWKCGHTSLAHIWSQINHVKWNDTNKNTLMDSLNHMKLDYTIRNRNYEHEQYATHTKIIIVRHPFSRLVSAFRDRIKSGNDWRVIPKIKQFIQGTYPERIETKKTDIETYTLSFRDVIEYLMSPDSKLDDHWSTQLTACNPCQFENVQVLRLESATVQPYFQQLAKLETQLELSEYHTHTTEGGVSDDQSTIAGLFETLDQNLLAKLVSFYRDDFEIFQYSPDQFITDNNIQILS